MELEKTAKCWAFLACGLPNQAKYIWDSLPTLTEGDKLLRSAVKLIIDVQLSQPSQPGASPVEQAVASALVLSYCHSDLARRTAAAKDLKRLIGSHNAIARLTGPSLAFADVDGDFGAGMAAVSAVPAPLENRAMHAMSLLAAGRYTEADAVAAEMTTKDDESSLSHLTTALVALMEGNYQDAYLSFGDAATSCPEEGALSPIVLSGKVVSNLHRRLWQEAGEDLRLASNSQGPWKSNILANSVVLARRQRQHTQAEEMFAQLTAIAPNHFLVVADRNLEDAFARIGKSSQVA